MWSPVGPPKTVVFIGTGHKYCPAALCFTGVEGNCVKLKNILVAWPHAPMSSTWKESHEHRNFPFYLRVTKDKKKQHKAPWHRRWSKTWSHRAVPGRWLWEDRKLPFASSVWLMSTCEQTLLPICSEMYFNEKVGRRFVKWAPVFSKLTRSSCHL